MENSKVQLQLETLRMERNRGSKELAQRKIKGEDISSILADLKVLSEKIKGIENRIRETKSSKIDNESSNNFSIDLGLYLPKKTNESALVKEINTSSEVISFSKFDSYRSDFSDLETENPVFPQLLFSWIRGWFLSEKIDEIIIVKAIQSKKLVGLGVFYRHSLLKVSIVESAPKNFGDFYDFLYCKNICKSSVARAILRELDNIDCDLVWLRNVNDNSFVCHAATEEGMFPLDESYVYTKWIKGLSSTESLRSVSEKLRYSIIRSNRRLIEEYGVEPVIEAVPTFEKYLELEHLFRNLYQKRWGTDASENAYKRRRMGLKSLISKGLALVYVLKINDQVIAYKIGFVFQSIFWEWKSCADTDFNNYSINDIFLSKLIPLLASTGSKAYNFMGGDYEYKKRWSDEQLLTINRCYIAPSTLLGRLFHVVLETKDLKVLFRKIRFGMRSIWLLKKVQ